MADEKLPFTAHLEELRRRLITCFIAIGVGFIISYFFSKRIFHVLMEPLVSVLPPEGSLIFTGVTEAFFTYLKVSFLAGIFMASPVVLYQLWSFISPGLYEREKSHVFPFVIFSTIFFVGGAMFGYYLVFPVGFKFFMSFASDVIRPLPSVKEYLSFSAKLLIAFGVMFELPLFVLFLSKIGIVNAKMLSSQRKYAFIIAFVAAALFTPPDVITQLMMAVPLLLLYEVSIWVARFFGKKQELP